MRLEDFMQISARLHTEWVAESQRNGSGIVAESLPYRSGILAQA